MPLHLRASRNRPPPTPNCRKSVGHTPSRGPLESRGSRAKALLRLHRPSLVTLNHISFPGPCKSVAKYAAISGHTSDNGTYNRRVPPLRWLEIRVSGLFSSDYIIDGDYMMGWTFDGSHSACTPGSSAPWQAKALNPFLIAVLKTLRDAAHPVFAFNNLLLYPKVALSNFHVLK